MAPKAKAPSRRGQNLRRRQEETVVSSSEPTFSQLWLSGPPNKNETLTLEEQLRSEFWKKQDKLPRCYSCRQSNSSMPSPALNNETGVGKLPCGCDYKEAIMEIYLVKKGIFKEVEEEKRVRSKNVRDIRDVSKYFTALSKWKVKKVLTATEKISLVRFKKIFKKEQENKKLTTNEKKFKDLLNIEIEKLEDPEQYTHDASGLDEIEKLTTGNEDDDDDDDEDDEDEDEDLAENEENTPKKSKGKKKAVQSLPRISSQPQTLKKHRRFLIQEFEIFHGEFTVPKMLNIAGARVAASNAQATKEANLGGTLIPVTPYDG